VLLSVCVLACGDGTRRSDEDCDDSNGLSFDGCDGSCKVEEGF
jgi:cysteine-rich repeat protein